jgi:hypothetical protein
MEKKNIKCIPSPGSRQWGVGPRCNRPPARCRRVPQPWARAQAAAPDLGWQQRRPAQGGQRRRRGRGWHQPPGGARTWGEGRGNGEVMFFWDGNSVRKKFPEHYLRPLWLVFWMGSTAFHGSPPT